MTNPTAYHAPTPDGAHLHTDADCHQLAGAITVTPTDPSDHPGREWCASCGSERRRESGDHRPPETVPCPCGTGHAERTAEPLREPFTFDRSKTATHYHYRHRCGFGGTVIVVGGAVHRRLGPVFHPERYGIGREYGPNTAGSLGVSAGD